MSLEIPTISSAKDPSSAVGQQPRVFGARSWARPPIANASSAPFWPRIGGHDVVWLCLLTAIESLCKCCSKIGAVNLPRLIERTPLMLPIHHVRLVWAHIVHFGRRAYRPHGQKTEFIISGCQVLMKPSTTFNEKFMACRETHSGRPAAFLNNGTDVICALDQKCLVIL